MVFGGQGGTPAATIWPWALVFNSAFTDSELKALYRVLNWSPCGPIPSERT